MSLHYLVKLEMLIGHMLPLSCYRNFRMYPTWTVAPNSPDLKPVDYSMWELLQEKMYKIHWSGRTETATENRVSQAGSWIMSSLWQLFVQISDACFVHRLLQYFPHAVIKWIQIWLNWKPQLRWDKFWSFFL